MPTTLKEMAAVTKRAKLVPEAAGLRGGYTNDLAPSLERQTQAQVNATVAEEFAHAMLRHHIDNSLTSEEAEAGYPNFPQEQDAKAQVIKWGFIPRSHPPSSKLGKATTPTIRVENFRPWSTVKVWLAEPDCTAAVFGCVALTPIGVSTRSHRLIVEVEDTNVQVVVKRSPGFGSDEFRVTLREQAGQRGQDILISGGLDKLRAFLLDKLECDPSRVEYACAQVNSSGVGHCESNYDAGEVKLLIRQISAEAKASEAKAASKTPVASIPAV